MTAPARITQADWDRAVKAASKTERARVIGRLAKGEIEIIIGGAPESDTERNDFDED